MKRFLLLSTALGLLLTAPALAGERRFAVVVGHNTSDDASLPALRYADDDALRNAELLGAIADDVVTLTSLDAESRELWGRPAISAPTRAGVIAAIGATKRKMAAARKAGHDVVLYFVYSGHGNYDAEGRGYVHLRDGRFTTRDIYHHVIAASTAPRTRVILMVDACNAALLVHSRGASERRRAGPTTLKLEDYPNVGVILASSSVGETHEWGRYLAGVFSHEVRSALMGPADLDDDGRITFAELAAFVAAANARVKNPTIRITPYIRPPLGDPDLALVDLSRTRFPAKLRIGSDITGKAHLVDEHMVRYADFHKTHGEEFWLAVPRAGRFVLVHGEDEYVVPAHAQGDLALADLENRSRSILTARGAGSAYFERTLFHQPYEQGWATNFLQRDWVNGLEVTRLVETPWYENTGAWVTVGAGAAALLTGVGLQLAANGKSDDAFAAPFAVDRLRLNGEVDDLQTSAWVMYGVGGAAVLGGVLWFLLDRPLVEERYRPPLEVKVAPGGLVVETKL